MSDKALKSLMKRVDALSLDEQLRLTAYLVERMRNSVPRQAPRRRWKDLIGLAEYPMLGEDAQAWVSRTRQESDVGREI